MITGLFNLFLNFILGIAEQDWFKYFMGFLFVYGAWSLFNRLFKR